MITGLAIVVLCFGSSASDDANVKAMIDTIKQRIAVTSIQCVFDCKEVDGENGALQERRISFAAQGSSLRFGTELQGFGSAYSLPTTPSEQLVQQLQGGKKRTVLNSEFEYFCVDGVWTERIEATLAQLPQFG